MNIISVHEKSEMGHKAANLFAAQILLKPDSVLGLATGETPRDLYRTLIEWYERGDLDFSKIVTFNLDEYVGLTSEHDQSYHYYMHGALFDHVNIRSECCHVLDGVAPDLEAECRAYDAHIEECGGIDMQLLGIGVNGHIAFNEPDTHFVKATHQVALTPSTISVNSQYFATPEEMPTSALTMGINTIFQARRIVLIANGPQKADILHAALFGPVTPEVPASILQMHRNVTVVADTDAMRVIMEQENGGTHL
jgi:glucosamine-6-phosphate deaminase